MEKSNDYTDLIAHLSGPHEWGYRDPVVGGFIADDTPFKAADVLALQARRPQPASNDLIAKAVMDALWPVLGGNYTDAATWQAISDAVVQALPPIQALSVASPREVRFEKALREIAGFDYEHDDMEMQIVCADLARAALDHLRGEE